MNSIRFSRSFFLRFAAGLKEYSVTTALPLCSTRADVLTNSLSLYIYIRRKPRARTKKVNRSKRSKRQTRRRRRRRKNANSDSENSDVIDDLSGDEVDQSNIIAGGRASRSTRPVFTKQMYAAANLEDESEDEE